MTKTDIIDRIASATGLTRLETEVVVNGFLATVAEALEEGDHVELRGFGSFRVQPRRARTARNPQTNEEVEIEARFVPAFRPGRGLRERIDAAAKRRAAG